MSTPSLDDQTLAELREIAARYPEKRSGLLPMLHLVQSVQGKVTPEGIEACADILEISGADVSGVATFYTMYKRHTVGKHLVGVCTNTLCAVMGGDQILERLQQHLDVGNDETTADGTITLEHVECNAACDFAPVMMVDWEFFDDMTPEKAVDLVDRLRAGEEVRSSRGPTIGSWRETERLLAGYPDGRVDEGPAAGPASTVGLEIARERGWTAPARADGSPPALPGSKQGAVAVADTQRAESETLQEQQPGPAGSADAEDGDA